MTRIERAADARLQALSAKDRDRGTGRTTQQMKDAAHGAFFIWHTVDLHYPKEIAKRIDRSDLRIIAVGHLGRGCYPLRGVNAPVVIDHWCRQTINAETLAEIEMHNRLVAARCTGSRND